MTMSNQNEHEGDQHAYSQGEHIWEGDDINDVFIREIYKTEAAFRAQSSSSSTRPDLENTPALSQRKRKRKLSADVDCQKPRSRSSSLTSLGFPLQLSGPSSSSSVQHKLNDDPAAVLQKSRQQIQWEVNAFNDYLHRSGRTPAIVETEVEMKKSREKWSEDEMRTLWSAISLHGNNWTNISKLVPGRNYFQVKDKGRRELSGRGWETGRKKREGSEALLHAQVIAQTELQLHYMQKEQKETMSKDAAKS